MYRENFENRLPFKSEIITVSRITALWAFSEAAFGGVLHALKLPFTGLFIGGVAIIFLTLIAYFAVFLQGLFAYIFFSLIPPKRLAALLLGITVLTLSAFQKFIVLTIIFGETLWDSINTFGNYILNQFMVDNSFTESVQLSYLLIGIYGGIYILGGIIFGIIAGNIHTWLAKNFFRVNEFNDFILKKDEHFAAYQKKSKKRKRWWKRKSGIAFILFSILMIMIVYFNPQFDDNLILSILIMIFRSIAVTVIWFGLLSPIVIKFIQKYLAKKKSQHTKEIDEILSMFPIFKGILNYSWNKTSHLKNYKRLSPFLKNTFVLLLLAEINLNE